MRKDITGQKFNRLTAIKFSHIKNCKTYWLFRCDCGNEKYMREDGVTGGSAKSCGCLQKEVLSQLKTNYKHGFVRTRVYRIWQAMRRRCYEPQFRDYKNYGGRGISVCQDWRESPEVFCKWALANGYSDNLSIDRIDVDGNYEPNNCRWADSKTQGRNTRTNKYFTINGETRCLIEWCEVYNINYRTVQARLVRGWDIERALTQPIEKRNFDKSKLQRK